MGQTRTIIRRAFVLMAFLAPLIFPFTFTLVLALIGAVISAWVPLIVGIIVDSLYWSSSAFSYPLWTLLGGLSSIVALIAHRFVETRIIRS